MCRVANRFGRCFPRKKETFDLNDLNPADHIVEESWWGLKKTFWHHMIVESVDSEKNQINVIHYYHDLDPVLKLPSICRASLKFTQNKFYRVVYEDNECRPPEEVLAWARERLDEKLYRPFINDCECFATDCKTSEQTPHQMWTAIEILGKSGIPTMLKNLLSLSTKTVEYGAKYSTHLSIIVAIVIEAGLCYRDYCVATTKFDEGKLTREEYCEVVVRRVCAAVCSIPGCEIGFLKGRKIAEYITRGLRRVCDAIFSIPGFEIVILKGGQIAEYITTHLRRVCAAIPGFETAFLNLSQIAKYITRGRAVALDVVGGALGDFLSKEAGGYRGDLIAPIFVDYFCKKDA